MIPETTTALLVFLLLLSPGLLFEWLRRQHRPRIDRSAFEEISTVVLSSIAFSFAAGLVIVAVGLLSEGVVADLTRWFREGADYAQRYPMTSMRTVGAAVAVAWFLAMLTNRFMSASWFKGIVKSGLFRGVTGQAGGARLDPHSVWWGVQTGRKSDAAQVHVSLELADDTTLTAVLHGFDVGGAVEDRWLVLEFPITISNAHGAAQVDPMGTWQLMMVPMSQVTRAAVRYPSSGSSSEEPELPLVELE